MSVWLFYSPALLLLLSVPVSILVMRGATALRLRHTGRRGPLRPGQAAHRYQQFRTWKPYRTLLLLTVEQRLFIVFGLILAVILTVLAFWVENMPHIAATNPTSGDGSNAVIPTPGTPTAAAAHTLFAVLIVVSGVLGIAALWTVVFGRMVNMYRADWYRAGLTDTERAEQKALRKASRRTATTS